MRLYTQIGLMLISLIALLSGYYVYQYLQQSRQPIASRAEVTDVILHHVSAWEFNSQGKLHSKIQTPLVTYSTHNGQATLHQPVIHYHNQQNSAFWLIHADTGYIEQKSATYKLTGHVCLQQPATANQAGKQLKTSELFFYPKNNLAKINDELTYKQLSASSQPGSHALYGEQLSVQAKGATIDTKTGEIKLLSETHAVLTPPKNSKPNKSNQNK